MPTPESAIEKFALLPCSGDTWLIAADWLEDQGLTVEASIFRQGIYEPITEEEGACYDEEPESGLYGYGLGSGCGTGTGYASGAGYCHGYGDGNGDGVGRGEGSGCGYSGDGDGFGDCWMEPL